MRLRTIMDDMTDPVLKLIGCLGEPFIGSYTEDYYERFVGDTMYYLHTMVGSKCVILKWETERSEVSMRTAKLSSPYVKQPPVIRNGLSDDEFLELWEKVWDTGSMRYY